MSEKKPDNVGGLSLQTLLISSLSAAAAAIIVPTFWEKGSLIATAITPVIVAVVSEALKRPAQAITTAAPKVARRTGTGIALRREQPTGVGARGAGPERVPGRGEQDGISTEDPFGLRAAHEPRRRIPLKLGVATGLAAAAIGAGVVTASELGLGHSITSSKRDTSLWGGRTTTTKKSTTATPTPTATSTARQSATPTPSATPSVSATPSATATPTASATPTPSATATSTP